MIVDTTNVPDKPVPNPNWPWAPGDETIQAITEIAADAQTYGTFNGVESLIRAYQIGGLRGMIERGYTGWDSAATLGLRDFAEGWNIALWHIESKMMDQGLL